MNTQQQKVIYFIRHGQSLDNISAVFQSNDSPLSPAGVKQATIIADRLSKIPFETLISSPIRRAKETAQCIADRVEKDITFSELFVERVKPAETSGKPHSDPQANAIWRSWEESLHTPGMRISNSENYDDLIKRADEALSFLTNRPESTIAVVTHGYFLRVLVARVLIGDNLTGPTLQRFQQRTELENTALTVLHYTPAFEEDFTWRLWTLNDHSHFAE